MLMVVLLPLLMNILYCWLISKSISSHHNCCFSVRFKVVNTEVADYLKSILKRRHDEDEDNREYLDSPIFLFADPFGYGGTVILNFV